MNLTENATAKKLADLGVTQPDQLTPYFAQARSRFDTESAQAQNEDSEAFPRRLVVANPASSRKSPTIG